MSAKDAGKLTVRGLVVPSEWDDRDEVSAVTLCTDTEERFEVVDRKMVRALMKHMDEEVEAVGFLAEDEYGEEIFRVVSFEPVEDEDDDFEDDLDDEDDFEDDEDDDEDDEDDDGDEDDDW